MTVTLSGFTTNGAISDTATIMPFGEVAVSDSIAGDTVDATISFATVNGTLSGSGLSAGVVSDGTVSYSLSATTPAALQAELQALTFTPTAYQSPPGSTVTTAFDLTVTGAIPSVLLQTLTSGIVNPDSVATDAAGDIFVSNYDDDTVEEFSSAGTLLQTLTSGISTPESVATDAAGDVYVASEGDESVQEFSAAGVLLNSIPTDNPVRLAIDAKGDVFVVNNGDNEVSEYAASGHLVRTLRSGLSTPVSLATDAAGDVFVANSSGNSVEEFSPTGTLLHTLTSGISIPESVATDAAGDVFVANTDNATVAEFAPDGTLLRVLKSGISAPTSVATDAAGDVFVTNYGSGNYSLEEFSPSGALLETLTSGIDFPVNVATDAAGDVFVANFQGNSVAEFAPAKASDASTMVAVTQTTPCYCRGTSILTEDGEVAVEKLEIGDRLMTLSGELRPIRWIGRRGHDGRFIAGNYGVLPICIKPDALAHGVPARDLWVSPDHSLYIDDVLVEAKHLVNGATVVQAESVDEVEYFHVELDSHDVIYADGALAETYADSGNRLMFTNGGEYIDRYPADDRAQRPLCAPLVEWGSPELVAIRSWMMDRTATLGYGTHGDADLHLIVGGAVVPAQAISLCVYRFAIPAGATAVHLASHSALPAEIDAASGDRRRLGVPVERIVLHHQDLTVEAWHGHPSLCEGFHEDEASHRWTDGMARIPDAWLRVFPDGAMLDLHVIPTELRYRAPSQDRAV